VKDFNFQVLDANILKSVMRQQSDKLNRQHADFPQRGKSAHSSEHRFLSILAKTLPPATMGFGWTGTIPARLRMAFLISLPDCPRNHHGRCFCVRSMTDEH